MCMLTGSYNHQLDAKNRIRIPARLRKELGDEFCFAKGDHHCLYVYPSEEMEKRLQSARETKVSDLSRIKELRQFMSTIAPVVEDNQGRIVLSTDYREHLNFEKGEKDIVVIGMIDRAEIWAKSNYDKYMEGVDDYDSVIAGLSF